MPTYRIVDDDENVTIVRTENAQASWEEETYWNGSNRVSKATGSQWEHETLFKSAKANYYVVHTSQWQGSSPSARFLTPQEAVQWLLANDHDDLPEDLKTYEAEVSE